MARRRTIEVMDKANDLDPTAYVPLSTSLTFFHAMLVGYTGRRLRGRN